VYLIRAPLSASQHLPLLHPFYLSLPLLPHNSKLETASLFKALSLKYRNRIAFGESRGSNQELASAYGITQFPTLLAFCNGDETLRVEHTGGMSSDALIQFFDQFSGGAKCRKMFRIDPSTDLNTLKIGQLKEILEMNGVRCGKSECLEKVDYVNKVREVLAAGAGGSAGGVRDDLQRGGGGGRLAAVGAAFCFPKTFRFPLVCLERRFYRARFLSPASTFRVRGQYIPSAGPEMNTV
jgi:hypothetical protein